MFLTTCFFPPTNAYMSPIMDQTDFHPKASRAASRSCKRRFVRDSVITIPFPLSAFFLAYFVSLGSTQKLNYYWSSPHIIVRRKWMNCYLIYHKYNFHIQGLLSCFGDIFTFMNNKTIWSAILFQVIIFFLNFFQLLLHVFNQLFKISKWSF